MRTEPTNTEWQQNVAGSHLNHGELLLAAGRIDEAAAASRIGCTMARRLVDRDASVVGWRTDLLAPCLMLRARIALTRGHQSEAASGAAQLLQIVDRQSRAGNQIRQQYRAAEALMLQGDIRAAAGQRELALQSWQAGLRRLPPEGADRPVERAQRVLLLERLGRQRDAAHLSAGLDSIGYRHPAYLNARQRI
jgi:tetratricopeptide (TPR) repeat protein